MKTEQLHDAIGQLDDDLLLEAQEMRTQQSEPENSKHTRKSAFRLMNRPQSWRRWVAAAVVLILCGSSYGIYHYRTMQQNTQKNSAHKQQESDSLIKDLHKYTAETIKVGELGSKIGETLPESSSPSLIPNDPYMVACAQYPEMVPYPNEWATQSSRKAWLASCEAQLNQPEGYDDGLEAFFSKTTGTFLSEAKGENLIYSPLNVYMALSLLSETSAGQSRQQLLNLLQVPNIETLRLKAAALWNATYCQDGKTTRLLANSLWMNENVDFLPETIDTLANSYYASSYQGKMGSPELTQSLQDWLNAQTGNLLRDQVSQTTLTEDTVLELLSTIYVKTNWLLPFYEEETTQDVFHAASGDVTCDFMHQELLDTYYRGENFGAYKLSCDSRNSGMWLILPDEGTSAETILEQGALNQTIFHSEQMQALEERTIRLSLPKFDITSNLELSDGLKSLGITDIFDANTADFSALSASPFSFSLHKIQHSARIMVDEKGCTAAAFTDIGVGFGSSIPDDPIIELNLNRPFLFVLVGSDELPLITGIVNQP